MTNLTTALRNAALLDDEQFARSFQVGRGLMNGRTARDCPSGHIMLRQPPSNEKDIRVTLTAEFMSKWKPSAWTNAGLKGKKVQLLLDQNEPGLVVFKPVHPDAIGMGLYRLEQNTEGGQARLMTTRAYLKRQLNQPIEFVPFEVQGDLAMADLRGLKDPASDQGPVSF